MKKLNCFVLCLTTLACLPILAQPPTAPPTPPDAPAQPPPATSFETRLKQVVARATSPETPALTRFDLDFPGGTPRQLAAAIEKALSRPLNVIVPDEFAETKLPALKMYGVDVSQLFEALEAVSQKSEAVVTSTSQGSSGPQPNYEITRTGYGFRTQGKKSDDSVWYFYVQKPVLPPLPPAAPPRVCRFYSLAPYLEAGLTVDDITTAIQTAWKMLGEKETPNISFHKDTKLLIAVGDPGKMLTINEALGSLSASTKRVVSDNAKAPEKP